MLRATGRVVRVESKPWQMNEGGQSRSGITRTVRLIVGDADFLDLKFPESDRQGRPVGLPSKGDYLDVGVTAAAPGGRLSVTYVGVWADLVGDVRPLAAVGSATAAK